MSIYNYNVKNKKGEIVSLNDYKGKVLLVINSATGCGFTPQYEALQKIYDEYKDKGFEILDFPCNQFANQAKGSDDDITNFCSLNYGVSFPQFAKIDVNGNNADPLFTFLKSKKGGILGNSIKWNFTKFLVNKDGTVLERFAPTTKPEDIKSKIENLLK